MGFFSGLKKLFKSKDSNKYPKTFCLKFDNIESFTEYVSYNHDFDDNYLYYYRGEANNLAKLIGSEWSSGEKDIPDLSLEYIGKCETKNNNIIFEDAIFIPDCVFDLANRYQFLDPAKPRNCMYRSDTSGFHQIHKFVVARENVYLCSK
jgi:hypothetical protein